MKKRYLLTGGIALAALSMNAMTSGMIVTEYLTLDLQHPTVPGAIEWGQNPYLEGSDGAYWSGTYGEDVKWLQFGEIMVSHTLGSSWGGTYWDGFTVAKGSDTFDHTETDDGGWIAHQWFNIAGGGIQSVDEGEVTVSPDAPYLVANWGYYDGAPQQTNQIKLTNNTPFTVEGVYVVNSTWTYYSNLRGAAPARALKEGDYVKLIAHAVDTDGTECTAEMKLASYEGELQQVEDWTWWDLSSLNTQEMSISSIYFTVESTDVGDWGMNTPAYFCLDRFRCSYYKMVETAVDDIDAPAEVAGVTYMNMAGQQAVEPFDGVNVVVTRYTDGTTSTAKMVK